MINRNQTQEQLLRVAIRSIIKESLIQKKTSRIRRLSVQPRLSEDYVVRVLGFSRTMLVESKRDLVLEGEIMIEHLIFEGFWSDAKEKILDKFKDNPITSATEAIKRFGNGVNGVVAALTSIVQSGGDAMETVVSGAKSLASKGKSAIIKSVRKLLSKIEEVTKKLGDAVAKKTEKVVGEITKFINGFDAKINEVMSEPGWKGMMGTLTVFLAIKAIRSRVDGVIEAALKMLTGEASKMISGALDIKNQVDDAVGEESEVAKPAGGDEGEAAASAIETVWNSIMNLAWGLVKKAAASAGTEAVEQLAGPAAWVKKLAEIFEKVGGGIAWVCEAVIEAVGRASFKPSTSSGQKEQPA